MRKPVMMFMAQHEERRTLSRLHGVARSENRSVAIPLHVLRLLHFAFPQT